MSSIFETIMLICFGLSWPINVMKAYKARTAKTDESAESGSETGDSAE